MRGSAALEPLHAVVPLRGLVTGKARLGEAIDAEEREELLLGMLRRTLGILGEWAPLRMTHVVTADSTAREVAEELGATVVHDAGNGLNAAIESGIEDAAANGAAAVMVLPADLPLLELVSLDGLLEAADAALAAGSGLPLVVISPSDARNGTNGMLLSPVDVIAPCFGPASFEAHIRAAHEAQATLQVVPDAGLGFDLDTPEDLERLPAHVIDGLLELGRRAPAGSTRS
jgi:2-phospho-L-lactate/phosphoenolpyruvate guanylyltransferase